LAEDALNTLAVALVIAEQSGQPFRNAELLRLKGECFLQLDDQTDEEAESLFREGIEIAQRQHAKSLELRAATSLAHLWLTQGKRTEARNLLRPVYDWFTEGFDTEDLKDAKVLLEELA
jgi:predicted ATPase